MSIDWSKAPDGCIGAFARIVGNQRKAFFVFSKRPSGYMSREGYEGEGEDGSYHVFSEFWEWLDKPWNGQGLPPVGTVCEYLDANLEWYEVEIFGIDKAQRRIFASPWMTIPYMGCSAPECFRPSRTPEQIAAEEREKAISEMFGTLQQSPWASTLKRCEILYDAGYRRQEEGK
ncbi:TPA: hypothetical protein ACQGQ1_000955 [Pseudomonas aeruginosa]